MGVSTVTPRLRWEVAPVTSVCTDDLFTWGVSCQAEGAEAGRGLGVGGALGPHGLNCTLSHEGFQ